MSTLESDTSAVVAHVRNTLGPQRSWTQFPGGYEGDIESALIDAVFSTRYSYDTEYGRGLRPKILAWQAARVRGPAGPSAAALLAEMTAAGGPSAWAESHFTLHVSGRGARKRLKAEVIQDAALMLVWQKLDNASAVTPASVGTFMDLLEAMDGIGLTSARYVAMLLGFSEVKPDSMVHRFIRVATGHWVGNAAAISIVKAAANALQIPDVRDLDHAIWDYQRQQPKPPA